MLLLLLIAATPAVSFVLDAPVEIDGRRVEQSTKLPWKPSFTIASGKSVVHVPLPESARELVVHASGPTLMVDVVEPAPAELRLVRRVDQLGAQYVLLNVSGEPHTLADPWLRFDGKPATECAARTAVAQLGARFPRIDEACFVDAKKRGAFSVEVRVAAAGQLGPIRRLYSLTREVSLEPDGAKRRQPFVRETLDGEEVCRCEGSPLWKPTVHPPGDYGSW